MKVFVVTLDQVEKKKEICGSCPSWQPSRIEGFYICKKYNTDSAIFLFERCADLGAFLTPERKK